MLKQVYVNHDHALAGVLGALEDANYVTVRDMETKELLNCTFTVEKPMQRCCFIPGRDGNVFAQVAETLWMLSGSNDLDWLERYIPQCKRWSDDGKTWRAGYGPRLRDWNRRVPSGKYLLDGTFVTDSVDQIAYVVGKINSDPETRQAIISLWDPDSDVVEGSKDYPCNNWLHFIKRDGLLHLNVAVRSNDAIYGFSHVDFFGWSVLQQLVASLTGSGVGTMSWNATSMHIYSHHYGKAHIITDNYRHNTLYPFMLSVNANEGLAGIDAEINSAMALHDDTLLQPHVTTLFDMFAYMLKLYNYYLEHIKHEQHGAKLFAATAYLKVCISKLPPCDMKQAVEQYFQDRL